MRRAEIRTTVASGPLALDQRRRTAAERGEVGLQIVAIEQLAAHLAGGFLRLATSAELDVAVRVALDAGGLECE